MLILNNIFKSFENVLNEVPTRCDFLWKAYPIRVNQITFIVLICAIHKKRHIVKLVLYSKFNITLMLFLKTD